MNKKRVGRVIFLSSLVLLVSSGILELVLVNRMIDAPTEPPPAPAIHYKYNSHGTVHYITKEESLLQDFLIVLPFIALGGVLIGRGLLRNGEGV